MVKKLKKISERKQGSAAGPMDGQLAGAVKDSAQQIWLAGMGAFAKAQEEGGKVFDALVKEGLALQRKTQAAAEEKIGEVTGRMSAMADTVTTRAGQNWDKLEAIFEQRTAKALKKLGVPTAHDVDALVQRVDALAAAVERLNPQAAPARARRAGGAAKAAAKAKSPGKTRSKAVAPATAPAQAPAEAAPAPAGRPARRSRKPAAAAPAA
jgi:poly(hydroxyalkanoate) granule-associated protein